MRFWFLATGLIFAAQAVWPQRGKTLPSGGVICLHNATEYHQQLANLPPQFQKLPAAFSTSIFGYYGAISINEAGGSLKLQAAVKTQDELYTANPYISSLCINPKGSYSITFANQAKGDPALKPYAGRFSANSIQVDGHDLSLTDQASFQHLYRGAQADVKANGGETRLRGEQ